jgi:putative tryptophan/tyrosine transport system substrate-binding protein
MLCSKNCVIAPAVFGYVVLAILGVLDTPLGVDAQQIGKVPRIAILTTASPPGSTSTDAFIRGLRDLGYIEGRNINIEWRWGRGTTERFAEYAADVVRLNVDVIVASSAAAGQAARLATKRIPIVIPTMADPVADGFVTSLARPGGNITGLTFHTPELQGKRLQLLKETLPGASPVALLMDSSEYRSRLREAESAASVLGIRTQPLVEVQGPGNLQAAFATITKEEAHAVLVVGGTMFYINRARLAQYALKARLPMMCPVREHVDAGCLMSYGTSLDDLFRNASRLVDRILKGTPPADLPVEQPTKFELVINLKTAKALGLTIPQSVLLRADEVIQ